MTSTRISQSINKTTKKITGSATFFQEDFTAAPAPTLMESLGGVKKLLGLKNLSAHGSLTVWRTITVDCASEAMC